MRAYSLMELRREPELLKTAKQYVFDRLSDGRFHPKIAKTISRIQPAGRENSNYGLIWLNFRAPGFVWYF
jgi:hypothetical protein